MNVINWVHVIFTGILWGISYYCRQSLSVIVDILEDDLNTTSSGIASLSSAILLPFCIMQIPAGLVLQIFSPEFSMSIGVLGIGVCSIFFGLIENVYSGVFVNILIGISASLVGLGPFTLAEERFGLKYIAFIVSIIQGIGILVCVGCQYIQSTIYQNSNKWRTMYYYYGFMSVCLAICYTVFMFVEAKFSVIANNIVQDTTDTPTESNTNNTNNTNEIEAGNDTNTDVYTNTNKDTNRSIAITKESKTDVNSNNTSNSDETIYNNVNNNGNDNNQCNCLQLRISRNYGIKQNNTSENDDELSNFWTQSNNAGIGNLKSLRSEMKIALLLAIKNPWNWFLGIYGIFISAITFGLSSLWLIPYLILKFDYQRSIASLINGSYTFAWGFGSVIFGKIILLPLCRARKISLLMGCIMEQSILIIIYIFNKNDNIDTSIIVLLNIISGLGSSVFLVYMNVVRDYNAIDKVQDAATGMINAFNFVGAMITQIFVGVLLDAFSEENNNNNNNTNSDDNEYSVETYNLAFIIFPIFGFLSIILTLVIKETYGEPIDLRKNKK